MTMRRFDSGNGATSLLIWHAIKHAAHKNIILDLDGDGNSGGTQFFKRFGGVVKPRYRIQKGSAAFRIVSKFLNRR
jgi:hypothetical protein